MTWVLWAAALYNLAWGALVLLLPRETLTWATMGAVAYPAIWQCVGMLVGVYGIGYACAARDPLRHWPIVLVGLIGKVIGPTGFAIAVSREELPWRFGLLIAGNDLPWLVPFAVILWLAARSGRACDQRPH